jgi:hypothetical protein
MVNQPRQQGLEVLRAEPKNSHHITTVVFQLLTIDSIYHVPFTHRALFYVYYVEAIP